MAAYRATTYCVHTGEGDFALRIGVPNREFDAFLLRQPLPFVLAGCSSVAGWGIITAYNPGELLADCQNQLHQRRLRERIAASGWSFHDARNVADDAVWPEEASYLVQPVDEQQILALGREFRQLAVVYGRTGLAPALLWT
jgi:hypothetical protein